MPTITVEVDRIRAAESFPFTYPTQMQNIVGRIFDAVTVALKDVGFGLEELEFGSDYYSTELVMRNKPALRLEINSTPDNRWGDDDSIKAIAKRVSIVVDRVMHADGLATWDLGCCVRIGPGEYVYRAYPQSAD